MRSIFHIIGVVFTVLVLFLASSAFAQRPSAERVDPDKPRFPGGPADGYTVQTHGFPSQYRSDNLNYGATIIVVVTDHKNRPVADLLGDTAGTTTSPSGETTQNSIAPFYVSGVHHMEDCGFVGSVDNLADNARSVPGAYKLSGWFESENNGSRCSWGSYLDLIYLVQIKHNLDIAGSAIGYAPRYIENAIVE